MAKADAKDAIDVASDAEPVTLDEFCMRLSKSDKRVELIGAFHFVENKAGRLKDAEHKYQARFEAFVNKPV